MGIFNWTKKKSGEAVDYGKKVVGTEDIKESFVYIKQMAKILDPRNAAKNSKKEFLRQHPELINQD
jgi:hypothetical protein